MQQEALEMHLQHQLFMREKAALARAVAYNSELVGSHDAPIDTNIRTSYDEVMRPSGNRASGSPSRETDVLLSDVNESTLQEISIERFKSPYLSVLPPEAATAKWPIKGVLHGTCIRPMVAMPVSRPRGEPVLVVFMVDTGAPSTFVSSSTFDALLPRGSPIPKETQLVLNSVHLQVASSKGHFKEINLLGADFLKAAFAKLEIEYYSEELDPWHVTISSLKSW
ncbi:hypothetical protein AB1Y20_008569 [Prymnesium parvum]|uniref:Peptidase A2 domain-containing protein n=1 Tax=Prymnesium parvum TaxID=97485 RepID=A0AB34IRW3_PRYPA